MLISKNLWQILLRSVLLLLWWELLVLWGLLVVLVTWRNCWNSPHSFVSYVALFMKQGTSRRHLPDNSVEWISSTALLTRTNTFSFSPAQQAAVLMGLLLHSSFRALLSCAGCLRDSPCSHTPRKSPFCLPTIRCLMGLHHGAIPGVVLAVTFSILLRGDA